MNLAQILDVESRAEPTWPTFDVVNAIARDIGLAARCEAGPAKGANMTQISSEMANALQELADAEANLDEAKDGLDEAQGNFDEAEQNIERLDYLGLRWTKS